MNDDRTMIREALREALDEGLEMLTEFAKDNPDVFRRGAVEFLKPRWTAEVTLPMRKELKAMEPEAFFATLEQIAGATSVEEAAELLNGGRQ